MRVLGGQSSKAVVHEGVRARSSAIAGALLSARLSLTWLNSSPNNQFSKENVASGWSVAKAPPIGRCHRVAIGVLA